MLEDTHSKEMLRMLKPSIEEASIITTKEDALKFILKNSMILGQPKDLEFTEEKKLEIFSSMLERDFLPHVGKNFNTKALFLGYMIKKLLKCFFKQVNYDDRDSYCNKRIKGY